jgi:DNA-binding transcriptional LysR family regulator
MLHSRKLQYIDEIARCGSIRKAAARLNVASSAINRQILALEEELGAQIFERLPRGLRLTAAGELCIEHIRDVLKAYDMLVSRVRGLKMPQAGRVSLVSTVGLAAGPLPELIARFSERHPRMRIQLAIDGATTTMNPVLSGEVDIGIGFNIPATPGLRTLATFDVPIGVVLPPDHPLAAESGPVDLIKVVQAPLVLALSGMSLRTQINLILSPLSLSVEPIVETGAPETLRHLVKRGMGLTFLNPLDVIEECRRGELVFRPLPEGQRRHQPMKIFARARATLDTATSLFVEFLMVELTALVEELQGKGYVLPQPSLIAASRSDDYRE